MSTQGSHHHRAYLALGSNLGDRLAHLQRAVDTLAATPGVLVVALSAVYATDPVGGPEQPEYLNAVVAIQTEHWSRELLGVAQSLEADAERVRTEHWGPRTLDVDVLWVDGEQVDDSDLVVPHPRIWERPFVVIPLGDVAPEFVGEHGAHDETGEDRSSGTGVRRTELHLELIESP